MADDPLIDRVGLRIARVLRESIYGCVSNHQQLGSSSTFSKKNEILYLLSGWRDGVKISGHFHCPAVSSQ